MKRKILLLSFLMILPVAAMAADPDFKAGTVIEVDGIANNTSVIITGRQPQFSWEYTGTISTFEIVVQLPPSTSPTTIWDYYGSTTIAKTINRITRIPFNKDGLAAAALNAGQTYLWSVGIGGTDQSTAAGQFTATSSVDTFPAQGLNLAIDWNNPFNPSKGQVTNFVFMSNDRDRRVQMRVFTLSGDLVRTWPEQPILQSATYTLTWDGKNDDGDIVARGIYLVSLLDIGEVKGVTKKVAVIKDK